MSTFSREPSFMMEPLPKERSICEIAASSAFSLSPLFKVVSLTSWRLFKAMRCTPYAERV